MLSSVFTPLSPPPPCPLWADDLAALFSVNHLLPLSCYGWYPSVMIWIQWCWNWALTGWKDQLCSSLPNSLFSDIMLVIWNQLW